MSNFCKFCGSPLKDGEPCSCKEAQQALANEPKKEEVHLEKATASPDPQEETKNPLAMDGATPQETTAVPSPSSPVPPQAPPVQQPPVMEGTPPSQPPQQPYHQQTPMGTPPNMPPTPPTQSFQVPPELAKTANAMGSSFLSFLKSPMSAMEQAGNTKTSHSLILLGIQFVAFLIFWLSAMGRFIFYTFPGFSIGFMIPLITFIGGTGALFLAILILSKLFQGTASASNIIGVIATAGIPITIVSVVNALLALLLGSFVGLSLQLISILFLFTSIFFLYLLERGFKHYLPSDIHRIMILAVSTTLHVLIAMAIFRGGLGEYLTGIWYDAFF